MHTRLGCGWLVRPARVWYLLYYYWVRYLVLLVVLPLAWLVTSARSYLSCGETTGTTVGGQWRWFGSHTSSYISMKQGCARARMQRGREGGAELLYQYHFSFAVMARQVKKNTPNKGRFFFVCGEKTQCKFFKWEA